ncbi:MOSC domain-containing protein [Adhaeribacter pallidiroseus]|uniref:Molybdenum cofactor sulfurase n=1 Tax=Adhaeribacter pallidiroseus TaxID=2072847 RepID=A0A369QQP5_9BACT|nr:MOSC N-terminal beta barrel domain-containing protein [Adhaeribacter pallidiroseus]RDC64498.1 Molybdenum cofactor sulfurase [Adhaeribacter pallidiroseus]
MTSSLVLTDIYIYPIKSLGGVRVDQAIVEPQGLQYDRRWLLVDETNRFLTQRVFPAMALLQVHLQPEGLLITHKKQLFENLFIPFDTRQYLPEYQTVTIWDDVVPALEVGPAVSAWFSRILQVNCRLVYMPPTVKRPVDPEYAINHEVVSFADAYPMLVIGQASLNDLNSRLAVPVPMNRFRPNLVFSGGEPFEEDTWRDFTINNQPFTGVKRCARCVLTTVNQDTAEKGTEPLRTLATYRTINKKVMFGQNVLPRAVGEPLRTGDPIAVLSHQNWNSNKLP